MSTGTSNDYWSKRNLPSIFKHELLRVYLPVFMARLSAKSEVAYIDGFAGEGRYEDGTPGSAEMSIKIANDLAQKFNRKFHLHYREKDAKSYEKLTSVLSETTHPNLSVDAKKGDISKELGGILNSHHNRPLLAFLDPCGFGAPYNLLVETMNRNKGNAPTELLLNFSHEAIRRGAGQKDGQRPTKATHQRITDVVGGDWWKEAYKDINSIDDFGALIAHDFATRLMKDTGASACVIPVMRSPGQKAIYSLVHVTRFPPASFRMFDAVSRAHTKWWDAIEAMEEPADTWALFEAPRKFDIARLVKDAMPLLKANINSLLEEKQSFKVAPATPHILGAYLGSLPDYAVRRALKEMEKEGSIVIHEGNRKVEYWVIQSLPTT